MTRKILALAAIAVLGNLPALAQTYDSRNQRELQERAVTRDLNNQQADQPGPYIMPPQYSYVPPPVYSYMPQPRYAYPYDYPPQPWTSRHYRGL